MLLQKKKDLNITDGLTKIKNMYPKSEMITGEKLQEIALVYFGDLSDFTFNPNILEQKQKHMVFQSISSAYNNPSIVFFYSHRFDEFASICHHFQNPFVLLSHNSDGEVRIDIPAIQTILQCPCRLYPSPSPRD